MDPQIDNEIGNIETRGKGIFEWKICNFFPLSENKDIYYSPDFFYSDSHWYLQIWLNESAEDGTEGWIGLFLCRRDIGPPKAMKFTIGIRKVNKTVEDLSKEHCHAFSVDSHIGKRKFLKRCELLKRQSVLVPSGTLALICTMKNHEQHSMEDSQLQRFRNLSRSFKKALDEGVNTDVVLKLKTREIRTHRFILESRSTVFKSMLNSDVHESRSGVIELADENEDAFDVALSYMYCGELEKMDSKNVCGVYIISHKYDLQELKKLCCVFIMNNMSMDLVCDVIPIVYLYEEAELKEYVKDYIAETATQIVEIEKWKELKRENPALVSELLERILVENLAKRPLKKLKTDNPSNTSIYKI